MIVRFAALSLTLLPFCGPALAASFDCAAAATPFEKAICENEALSADDEVLAKSFATAIGGLDKPGVAAMRADQRVWLDFAQRACSDDAEPMSAGRYDDDAVTCLGNIFTSRSGVLEESRMIRGHRVMVKSAYAALPDPEPESADSYWRVATHELVYPQFEAGDPLADKFNAFVETQLTGLSPLAPGGSEIDLDGSSDTATTLSINEITAVRVTLDVSTYWYGHGAAHGNYTKSYIHYLVDEDRAVEASDVFTGEGWQAALSEAAWQALQEQHGEWLQVDGPTDIADMVVDPSRWDLSDAYALSIQFQPYDVSAYAYGAPSVLIPWDKLAAYAAPNQDRLRYGY